MFNYGRQGRWCRALEQEQPRQSSVHEPGPSTQSPTEILASNGRRQGGQCSVGDGAGLLAPESGTVETFAPRNRAQLF